jgi:hypothetical protein
MFDDVQLLVLARPPENSRDSHPARLSWPIRTLPGTCGGSRQNLLAKVFEAGLSSVLKPCQSYT